MHKIKPISVINGTEIKGCAHHIREIFLDALGAGHEVTQFTLPKDAHVLFWMQNMFFKDETLCPHAPAVMPIWKESWFRI
jgi:hypothetical protein